MIDELIAQRPHKLSIQVFRYIAVGGWAFLVDFSILYFLTEFGQIHYLVSAAIAFSIAIIISYILSVTWVFSQRSVSNRLHEFLIFLVIGILGLLLTEALMYVFTGLLHYHYLESKVIATVAILFFNFTARKTLLFSDKNIGNAQTR